MELEPLAASPFEVVLTAALVTAIVFTAHAIWKVARHDWPVGFALTLVVLTFVVPFSGPVLLGLQSLWRRRRVAHPLAVRR
ncbi:MAG: hypothetical protein Q7T71_18240 [Herbiconiux sp.]|nr:hypothetical protein [Herbiconiux sp.]